MRYYLLCTLPLVLVTYVVFYEVSFVLRTLCRSEKYGYCMTSVNCIGALRYQWSLGMWTTTDVMSRMWILVCVVRAISSCTTSYYLCIADNSHVSLCICICTDVVLWSKRRVYMIVRSVLQYIVICAVFTAYGLCYRLPVSMLHVSFLLDLLPICVRGEILKPRGVASGAGRYFCCCASIV